jgi:hypothetical protein
MIVIVVMPAIALSMLQASITAPTEAFRGCLREAAAKATSEKVTGDKIEDYLRNACTVQMTTLKEALVAFRLKNGMSRKEAGSDAEMTVDDYVSTPADNYKFMINYDAPKPAPAAAPANPAPTQPQPSSQPPKP